MNYPSIANSGNSQLFAAYLESLHPRRAELFFFMSGLLRDELSEICVRDQIAHDEWIDRDNEGFESTTQIRLNAGTKQVAAYKMPAVMLPVSKKLADHPPFDYAAYLADGGSPIRELWINIVSGDTEGGNGTVFQPGIDATAYTINGTGNPKLNPRDLANAFVWTDKYGFRVAPGTKDAHRFQCVMNTQGQWWFVLADPVV